MYNYGSEAIEISHPSFAAEEIKGKKQQSAPKKEAYIRAIKHRALRTLAIIAAILAVLMAREAKIDQLCGRVTRINEDIYKLNAMITEREMHLSYQLDMNNIDQIAVSRLGMKKPDTSQYIYIDVEKNTGGEILVDDGAGTGGFSAFMNKAKILLEYLY